MPAQTESTNRISMAQALMCVFVPLVRMLLRHGVSYQTCAGWLRWCYVNVASEEFTIPGRRQSKSRVAVVTGLTRFDVDRVQGQSAPDETPEKEQYHRAARVLAAWAREPAYQDEQGQPRVLPFEGRHPAFSGLVKRFSGGTPPRAILDELVRIGAVKVQSRKAIHLLTPQYAPDAGELTVNLDTLGRIASGMVATIDPTTRPDCIGAWHQNQCFSHRISNAQAQAAREYIKQRGDEWLFEIENYLHRLALAADPTEPLIEVGAGVYLSQTQLDMEQDAVNASS